MKKIFKILIFSMIVFSFFMIVFSQNKVYAISPYTFLSYTYDDEGWGSTFNTLESKPNIVTYVEIIEIDIPIDYIYSFDITGVYSKPSTTGDILIRVIGYYFDSDFNYLGVRVHSTNSLRMVDTAQTNKSFTITNNSVDLSDSTYKDDITYAQYVIAASRVDSSIGVNVSELKINDYYVSTYVESSTVTFNSNGGSAVSSQEVDPDSLATEPTEPTRSGYQFQGWYTDDGTFLNEWDFSTDTVTENITLYAKWYEGWQVTFDSNGGSVVSNIENVTNDTTITAPTPPTRVGYNFVRWDYISDAGPPLVFSAWNFTEMTVTSNLTLFAVWKQVFTVTFNSNGGSAIDSQNVESGDFASLPDPPPTRTGYTFNGWYDDDGTFLNEWDAEQFGTQAINEDLTLYAEWIINQYTVTFFPNGGTAVDTQLIDYDTLATEPTAPTRTGHTFVGWYTDDGTFLNEWDFTLDSVTEDINLFASWTINEYTVTFNAQGGTPTPAVQTVDYQDFLVAPTAPTRVGFTFGGWYKEIELENKWRFNVDVVEEDATLYAKWIPDIEDAIDDYLAGTIFGTPFGKMFIAIVFILSLIVVLGLMKAGGSIVLFMAFLMFITFISLEFIPAWIIILLVILMFVIGYFSLSGGGNGVIIDD